MFKLTPGNDKFYDLFDRSANFLVETAREFHELIDKFDDVDRRVKAIKALEHQADEVTHEAMELLHSSFITPFDRGDIRRVIIRLDDVVDFIDDATSRIVLYEIREIFPPVRALTSTLHEAATATRNTVTELRKLHKTNEILRRCVEIKRLETAGDKNHHEALAALFRSGMDPLSVIKWKEIVEDLESALDRCEDVANLVEGIVLENA